MKKLILLIFTLFFVGCASEKGADLQKSQLPWTEPADWEAPSILNPAIRY